MATATALMTAEELLALPRDDLDRWLVEGELRERPMTVRNQHHCNAMTQLAMYLGQWRKTRPEPRGKVLTGDAGVVLQKNPDTVFGIDLAYISAEVLSRQTGNSSIIEGVPTLAVEILSPSDTVEEIHEKVNAYLTTGVPLTWIVDPYRRTVTVFTADAEPVLVSGSKELSGEPHLPGFRVRVEDIFE